MAKQLQCNYKVQDKSTINSEMLTTSLAGHQVLTAQYYIN